MISDRIEDPDLIKLIIYIFLCKTLTECTKLKIVHPATQNG